MAGFLRSLRRGVEAAAEAPRTRRYEFEGRFLVCLLCGHDRFLQGAASPSTGWSRFFHMDWAAPTMTTFTCEQCGRIEWFAQPPQPAE